jgi:hypothetical protein
VPLGWTPFFRRPVRPLTDRKHIPANVVYLTMNIDSLTIRMARQEDTPALRRLAELDSAVPLRGAVMLAELDGTSLAAISLETGEVTANPFERTAAIVSHLRMRRYQVMRQGGDVAPARSLLRRLAPMPTR